MAKKKDRDESEGQIAWDTAEVKGGDLSVDIEGDVSDAWRKRITKVVERLDGSGSLGTVKVKRSKLVVAGVVEGREADLRHLLEGAVQQVNSDFAPEPDDRDGRTSDQDARMTEAFRSFAEPV
jgi:hypothetical protein